MADDIEDDEIKSEKEADDDILEDSRDGLKACIEDEQTEREKMLDDLRFATLDQWPQDIRRQREGDVLNGPRPCLTIDQINQYITQVSNDLRKNRPSVKIRPINDQADPETAKVFQGVIRHIEDRSNAAIAYQTAGDSAVTIGLGFFRITTDYVSPDSFDQEILIKRLPDTFGVYLGTHIMPDGSDAEEGWIFEKMPLEQFKREYPKAAFADADFEDLGILPTWKTPETITICEYFYKEYTKAKLFFLADGRTMFSDEYDKLDPKPEITGKRDSQKVSVKWCKHSGCEILEKRDWLGKFIPIVEVVGREKMVDGKRVIWGLVRPAKDSLRAFNYWISAMVEKMALAPKAPWLGAVGQFKTQGARFDKANINNYAKLEYDAIDVNGNQVPAPRREQPMQMEAAMSQMLGLMQNNVKSSLGMYKASIGDTESQQSGRAILALQKESDTGTAHFGDNQGIAVAYCGRILVDLIPKINDTKSVLHILGEDGRPDTASIDPNQRESMRQTMDATGKIKRIYNLGVGTFDVTVTVGPGYTTSRQEAATVMTDLANTAKDPGSAAIMHYGAIKNSDFHGSEEITGMLKTMLPPPVQQMLGAGDQAPIPPAAMQKIAELTQHMQVAMQEAQKLQQENQQLKAGVQDTQIKTAAQAQEKDAERKLKYQIHQEDMQAATEKVNNDMVMEDRKAAHATALAGLQEQDQTDRELRKAALQAATSIEIARITATKDAAEGQTPAAGTDATAIMQQILDTQNKLLQAHAAPRKISMTLPDGRVATASSEMVQ